MNFLKRFGECFSQKRLGKCSSSKFQTSLMDRFSYESRTLLTGILGYSEFLELSSEDAMVAFTAKIIHESSQGLVRVMNSFFDLHYLKLAQIKVNCSSFSATELVRDVVRSNQKYARERRVTIFFMCSDDSILHEMYSDVERVRQVLNALIYNALQMSSKNDTINVNVNLDQEQEYFELKISLLKTTFNAVQLNIMDEFWVSSDYEFKLHEGPGLEMALAKEMIIFLQGKAKWKARLTDNPHLIVSLPMQYTC